jgi:hypothetical protein
MSPFRIQRNAIPNGRQKNPKPASVTIKTPWPTNLNNFQPWFIMSVEQFVCDFSGGRLIGQLKSFRAEPLYAYHGDEGVGYYSANGCIGLEVVEVDHRIILIKVISFVEKENPFHCSAEKGRNMLAYVLSAQLSRICYKNDMFDLEKEYGKANLPIAY